jgi:hypothetical protein
MTEGYLAKHRVALPDSQICGSGAFLAGKIQFHVPWNETKGRIV